MRRVGVLLLLVGGLLGALPAAPAGAGSAATADVADLQGRRAQLLLEIAELTDDAAAASELAVEARRQQDDMVEEQAAARGRLAQHAVGAYLDGVTLTDDGRLRRMAWADIIADADRRVLADLDRRADAAVDAQRRAITAVHQAQRAAARLEGLRRDLDRMMAERVAADADAAAAADAQAEAAAAARRQAIATRARATAAETAARTQAVTAAAQVRGGTRTVKAMLEQGALMGRYPFGPVGGVPGGLQLTGHAFAGRASWYGPGFDGRQTATGAIYDQEGWTVAHRTLPLGTMLLVTHGNRAVLVLVNDRGPYVDGRVLDLSHGVAQALGTVRAGVAPVHAYVVAPA